MKPIASPRETPAPQGDFALEAFLPYRLSVLSNTVSDAIARLYRDRFGLSIAEWRCMAVLGRFAPLAARDVARATAMDKVQVSRAISRMLDSALILRESGDTDRRKALLTLTPKAHRIYREIVPMALAYEAKLTGTLSDEEATMLDRLLGKLQARAEELSAVP